MERLRIYTIGYTLFQKGNLFDLEEMFNVLHSYNITCLVDVRSIPYSKQFPQCNADSLKYAGKIHGIPYLHMPELGAKACPDKDVFSKASDIFFEDIFPIAKSSRPEKTELYATDEIVDFSKFRNDEYFSDGLKRIENAYDKNYTLALMCSEKKPIDCHRYFLISRKIESIFGEWLDVMHIIRDELGQIATVTNQTLDQELRGLIFSKNEIAEGRNIHNISVPDGAGRNIRTQASAVYKAYFSVCSVPECVCIEITKVCFAVSYKPGA